MRPTRLPRSAAGTLARRTSMPGRTATSPEPAGRGGGTAWRMMVSGTRIRNGTSALVVNRTPSRYTDVSDAAQCVDRFHAEGAARWEVGCGAHDGGQEADDRSQREGVQGANAEQNR